MILALLLACAAECTDSKGTHASGDTWACPDGCNTCSCDNGDILSTAMGCVVTCTDTDGTIYSAGDVWDAGDGCNTCSCESDGSIGCTDLGCGG